VVWRAWLASAAVVATFTLSAAPASAGAVRSQFFGITQGPPISDADLAGIQRAHVRTTRYLISWESVQPKKCCFNWGARDLLMGRLAARGIRVVPALWGSPSWAETYPAKPPLDKLAAWQTFLRAFAARYGPGGGFWKNYFHNKYPTKTPLPVHTYQIWNEPNLKKYWVPYPVPKNYGKLLIASHRAIRSADPKARVLLGGMPATPPSTSGISATDFLSQLYNQVPGVKNDFEAAALHPYAPTTSAVQTAITKFRTVMNSHGDGATRLWITEIAWGSAPPTSALNEGLQGQATLLKGAYKMILANRKTWNVQGLFWYRWRDPLKSRAYKCTFCPTAGLVKHDYTAKPALSVFKSFTAETTPPVATITFPTANGYKFTTHTPTFKFTSNEPGSTFQCKVNRGTFKVCSSPYKTAFLANGSHTFSVRAIDAPGNVSAAASRSFTVAGR
jgi:Glycosyl hydrolase catalytic core